MTLEKIKGQTKDRGQSPEPWTKARLSEVVQARNISLGLLTWEEGGGKWVLYVNHRNLILTQVSILLRKIMHKNAEKFKPKVLQPGIKIQDVKRWRAKVK